MSIERPEYVPSTQDIRDAFHDEIVSLGGMVSDTFDDGNHLFARAILDSGDEVRPGDRIRAGVALRAVDAEIEVCPYTFRLVCTNGAIVAHALESRALDRAPVGVFVPSYDAAVSLSELRRGVRECAKKQVFSDAMADLRLAAATPADTTLQIVLALARMSHEMIEHFMPLITERFSGAGDPTVFGIMNAVTSLARDTEDQETRWSLETVGGRIPARLAEVRSVRAIRTASNPLESAVSLVAS